MNILMPSIYYGPNQNRKAEAQFAGALMRAFPDTSIVEQQFSIRAEYLDCYVSRDQLIAWLEADTLLPQRRRNLCIERLKDCPSLIQVCLSPLDISFDLVLVTGTRLCYFEFHEDQHWRLTVPRPSMVYSPENEEIPVPRFLQRLVRDVWRVLTFRPYTLVWKDWFLRNEDDYRPTPAEDLELSLPGKFRFDRFCHLREHG